LESVAKDLGFDSRELTDILDQFPVEDSLVAGGEIEDDNGLSRIHIHHKSNLIRFLLYNKFLDDLNKVDAGDDALMDVMRNVKNSHSWADVEQFLLEQDGIGQGIHQGQHCISGQIVGLNQHIPTRHDRLFHDSASLVMNSDIISTSEH
jgi:hypothetical protein